MDRERPTPLARTGILQPLDGASSAGGGARDVERGARGQERRARGQGRRARTRSQRRGVRGGDRPWGAGREVRTVGCAPRGAGRIYALDKPPLAARLPAGHAVRSPLILRSALYASMSRVLTPRGPLSAHLAGRTPHLAARMPAGRALRS